MKYLKKLFLAFACIITVPILAFCLYGCKDTNNQTPPTEPKEEITCSATITGEYNGHEFFTNTISYKQSSGLTFTAPDVIGYKFKCYENISDNATILLTEDLNNSQIKAMYEPDFLTLPVVWLQTENNQQITSKEDYVNCSVSILNTDDEYLMNNISAGIRGRGNSTWFYDKKPYRIKFDKKQSVLGSSYKAKSWTLIANYLDKSLSRNHIAYNLASQFDDIAFSSSSHFVEVYLNNEYLGVYQLCDQMQTGNGRVDIEEDYYNYHDGDTGYLLEIDAIDRILADNITENLDYFGINDLYYVIKTPDTEESDFLNNSSVYINFIKDYFNKCINAFDENDYISVCDLIDVNSFADTYIIHELFANNDVGYSSFYLYKNSGDKLTSGPVWDFDIAGGNLNYNAGNAINCPSTGYLWAATQNYWYKNLLKFDEFKSLVSDKLRIYKQKIENTLLLLDNNNTESIYTMYYLSLERNFVRWQIMGKDLWPEPAEVVKLDTLQKQLTYLKDWLTERYNYLLEYYNQTDL